MDELYDVIVVGAGAAGLIGALEIALTGRSVLVIEAKEQSGGRIKTVFMESNYPVELGAEFIHGKLPLTLNLAKKAGLKKVKVRGNIWQHKDGKLKKQGDFIEDFSRMEKLLGKVEEDCSVEDFINKHLQGDKNAELRLTLQHYVEGYYAADTKKASTFALREELLNGEDDQYRLKDGYESLVNYLEKECTLNGVEFKFFELVKQIKWKKGSVEVSTDVSLYRAKKAMVTVSVGVLQAEGIAFFPSLPHIKNAALKLGFGQVIKINLWMEKAFWKDKKLTENNKLADLNFLFSEETIPTWWTQHPNKAPLLTGWLGGPKTEALNSLSKEEIRSKAIQSLAGIFKCDENYLIQQVEHTEIYKWFSDPHFNGAYSYAVLDGDTSMQQILEPVEKTIFFAGEGLHNGNEIGTVEAALQSGKNVAQNLIASFQ